MHFGREYYTMLSCEPERLHCFYGKQSSLLHCQEEDTDAAVCVGLEEIHQRLVAMGYNGARVVIGNIDCQPSMNGGILIFVLGTMHWPSGMARKFAQTFLLAEQPNGYFVLNDILRLLAEPAEIIKSEKKATVVKSMEKPATIGTKQVEPAPEIKKAEPIPEPKKVDEPVKSVERLVEGKPVSKKTATPAKKVEEEKPTEDLSASPSSWAKLAAVQQNRWGSGVVAESKGPVASVAVETSKPQGQKDQGGRINYRTNQSPSPGGPAANAQTGRKDSPRQWVDRRPAEYDPAKSIYVSNIIGHIHKDQLRKQFEAHGPIKSFEVSFNKGVAFIEYEAVDGAATACQASMSYNDSAITVQMRRSPGLANRGSNQQERGERREHVPRNRD
jgi:outer membrane biosynthesis protein TonB